MSAEREPLLQDEADGIGSIGDGNDHFQDNIRSESQSNRIQNGKFTLLEKALFTLAITFFISLCVVAGLYTRRVYEEKPKNPPPTVPAPPGSNNTAVGLFVSFSFP